MPFDQARDSRQSMLLIKEQAELEKSCPLTFVHICIDACCR
jgi:hypothetical protein